MPITGASVPKVASNSMTSTEGPSDISLTTRFSRSGANGRPRWVSISTTPRPGDRTGDVTLVFSLGAARRLSDPGSSDRERAEVEPPRRDRRQRRRRSRAIRPRDGCRERLHAPELGQVGTLGDIHEESGAPRRCSSARRLRTVASRPTSASSTCRSTRRPRRRDGRSRSPNGRANRGDQSPVAGAESGSTDRWRRYSERTVERR